MKVVVVCFKTEEVDVFNENRLVTFYFKTGKKYEGKIEGEYIKIKISEDVSLTVTEDFFINHFYVADSSSEEDIELNKNYVLKMDTVLFKKETLLPHLQNLIMIGRILFPKKIIRKNTKTTHINTKGLELNVSPIFMLRD